MDKKLTFLVAIHFFIFFYGISSGEGVKDRSFLSSIKKITLSIEINELAEVEIKGPYASAGLISSKDVPDEKKKLEEWLLQVLKMAVENAGYEVVKANQTHDATLFGKYNESIQNGVWFTLKLILKHPKGGTFSTTTEGRVMNPPPEGKNIGAAPSEEIKKAIMKDLQKKLPFK